MSAQVRLTWAQALAWRLGRHLLSPVGAQSPAGVVDRLGAVLSMDESLAELAVRTRRESSEPGELADALASGELIKAFAFRGSMHYLSARSAGSYLAVRAAGRQWARSSWVDFYRLTADDWPDFRAAVREALAGGPLTVDELGAALARDPRYRHLEPVFDDGAGTLIKPLSWQGDLSIAPSRDGRLTLQGLADNPRWAGIPPLEEAGPAAIVAYLRSYGPATPDHLDYWLGGGLSAGRRRLQSWWHGLGDRLVPVDVDGATAYVASEDVDDLVTAEPSDSVRLLPGHDQWVMGPGTKDEHVTPGGLRDLVTRKANPVICGGVVSGTWRRSGTELEVTWLASGRPPGPALEQETERLSRLLASDLRLAVTATSD